MNDPTVNRWHDISELFNDIVDLDPPQRMERLAKVGKNDPALRASVESLLAADAVADERLSRFDTGVSEVVRSNTLASFADAADPLGIAGQSLSHFRIRGFLASGGMGVVYDTEDTRLNRSVALKFPLPHQRLAERVKSRFIREAQAAGALDHINLCPIYEVGESDHGLFLAMPLYKGETLKHRLEREHQLPIAEALDIARQIAAGLTHAHESGVIHRDLKPGNVMLLPDGTVKVLDFGLARTHDVTHTNSEVTLGTVSYMAPEQIRGSKVDARADLWSVGVILYEMLTGARPFTGDREVAIAHAILHNEPRAPSLLRPEIPKGVQDLVLSLLEKDSRVRYQRARDLKGDLDGIAAGRAPTFRAAPTSRLLAWSRRRRVPLVLGAAVAGTALLVATVPRLSARVSLPTRSAEAYDFYQRGREYERLGPMAAAESLYLRALALDTSFALARARLAIVYAECRAGGSRDCPRRTNPNPRSDVERIRTTAEAALRQQPRLAEAHFALGLYWERREEHARAIAEFNLAREELGGTGALHAAIARSYRALGQWDQAIAELKRAIGLDPADVTSLADLATTYSRLRRYDESVRHWDRYLARRPDAFEGRIIRGHVYLRWLGTVDTLAAIVAALPEETRRRSLVTRVFVARLQGRPNDALAALDLAPRLPPQDTAALSFPPLLRAQVYADMGDSVRARAYFDTARVHLERLTAIKPDGYRALLALGLAYAGVGRHVEAKRMADSAAAFMPLSRSVPLGTTVMREMAQIFAQIPEYHGLAFVILDSLLDMPAGREASVPLLRIEPTWAPLRADPRWQALLVKYSPR